MLGGLSLCICKEANLCGHGNKLMCKFLRFVHWNWTRTLVKFQKSQILYTGKWMKKKINSPIKIPVWKVIASETVLTSLRLLFRVAPLCFLAITYPSTRRIFNLEHLHADDRMVNFWHQHLVIHAYLAIGKQTLFLIGSYEKAEHLYWSLKKQRTLFQPIKIQL